MRSRWRYARRLKSPAKAEREYPLYARVFKMGWGLFDGRPQSVAGAHIKHLACNVN